MPTKRKIPTLDLFSGAGGHALALHGVSDPVAYCEIDPFPRSILAARIADGRLPKAPVLLDVTKVRGSDLPRAPTMITASFPCQDISAAGNRTGLSGARSRLFWDVVRIMDEVDAAAKGGGKKASHGASGKVRAVLMENSPMIYHSGLDDIVKAFKARGFDCAYGRFSAKHVGARHTRMRWYFLAVRPGGPVTEGILERLASAKLAYAHAFKRLEAATPRLAKKSDVAVQRVSVMGNAVLPQVVALACRVLAPALQEPRPPGTGTGPREIDVGEGWTRRFPSEVKTVTYPPLDIPRRGDKLRTWPTPAHKIEKPQIKSELENSSQGYCSLINRVFHEAATCKKYGLRNECDIERMRGLYGLNPRWVEALMGFPRDWTAPAPAPKDKKNK